MQIKDIMFAAWCLIGGLFISQLMQGAYFDATDRTIFDSLMLFRIWSVGGFFSVPILNFNFFFTGLPNLLQWNYAFFGGDFAIVQYLFYSLSVGIAWGAAITFIGVRVWNR